MQHTVKISLWRQWHWDLLFLWVLVPFQCHMVADVLSVLWVCPQSVEGGLHVSVQCQEQLEPAPGSAVSCFESPGCFLFYIWTPSRISSNSFLRQLLLSAGFTPSCHNILLFPACLKCSFLSFSLAKLSSNFIIMTCSHFICNGFPMSVSEAVTAC